MSSNATNTIDWLGPRMPRCKMYSVVRSNTWNLLFPNSSAQNSRTLINLNYAIFESYFERCNEGLIVISLTESDKLYGITLKDRSLVNMLKTDKCLTANDLSKSYSNRIPDTSCDTAIPTLDWTERGWLLMKKIQETSQTALRVLWGDFCLWTFWYGFRLLWCIDDTSHH